MKNLYQTSKEIITRQDVWNKGTVLGGNSNPEIYRMDRYGAVMKWDAYNMPEHKYAWTIDFLDGNADNTVLGNLMPVYWYNKRTDPLPEGISPNRFFTFNNSEKKNNQQFVNKRRA